MPQARDEAGNIWEVDAQGNPVRLIQPAQQQGDVLTLPPDPMDVNRDQRAANADARAQASLDLARQAAARADMTANKPPPGYRWNNGGLEAIPGGPADPKTLQAATRPALTAKERADAIAGFKSGESLDRIVAQLEEQYKSGPGSTTGIAGVRDYFPLTANRQFDSTANAARGIVGSALGFTGGQLNTATEAAMAVGPYLPQSDDRDDVIRDKIERLRQLANDARTRSVAILGGIPDANGRVTPSSVWQQTYATPSGALGAAAAGSAAQGRPIDPAMQAELNAYVAQNGSNITPEGLSQFITGLYAKYGGSPDFGLGDYAKVTADRLKTGGQINTNIPPQTAPLSGVDAFRNDLVNNPFGAGAVGYLDAMGVGGVSALAPEQFQALSDASTGNALAMMGGQIAGSITGTGALGALGRNTIGRAVPASMGGGARGALMRDLGTDILYSGVYGANQGQDALGSAAAGGVGSLIGRGVGNVAGRAIGGLELPAAAQVLRSRGVPLTVGQSLGGIGKSIEDRMTSIPGIGDLVNQRRLEGFQGFNRAAMDEGGAPIGATVSDIGETGVNQLEQQVGDTYTGVTRGKNVPFDPRFDTDMTNIAQAARRMPEDYQSAFDQIGQYRIDPLIQRGSISGEDYQQAIRGLKSARRGAESVGQSGFEQEYRNVLTQSMDALRGQMERGGGRSVVEGLSKADEANRLVKTLKDAVKRAGAGTRSGEIQVFTPSQLLSASQATASKYPGARPFAELTDAGQTVLPSSIPDSGTASRVAQMAIPGFLTGAGGGAGYLAGGQEGAQSGALTGLALAAALGLGGTKAGQKALTNALFVRPDAIRVAGKKTLKRAGMFGSGAIPLVLPIAAD